MLRFWGLFLPVRTLTLLLAEILLVSLAFFLFLSPIPGPRVGPSAGIALSAQFAVILALMTIITMVAAGLYNRDALLDYRAMLARVVMVFALEVPVIFAASFFYRDLVWAEAPPWLSWYVKAMLAVFACLLITRAVFLLLADSGALKRRVVVIGTGRRASCIQQLSERVAGSQFVAAAFVASPKDPRTVSDCAFSLDESLDAETLFQLARRCGAREIVVATDDRRGLPVEPLLGCKARGIAVTEFLTFCERETGRVDLDGLQPSWLIFSDGFRMGAFARAVKRAFDIVVSALMLALTLPLLLLTALAIKLEDGGSIIYAQERVGQFGRVFTLYKFRSMREDAEQDSAPQWAAQRDARVTAVGRIIRKFRIDELPQLINVLKGEMSFVGPRPERPFFVEQLTREVPFYGERHAVKPGITGWAQINYPYGASLQDARNKLSYDLYYVKNHTLLIDLIVLIQTARVIVFADGAR